MKTNAVQFEALVELILKYNIEGNSTKYLLDKYEK
jgi:hypothetical protein